MLRIREDSERVGKQPPGLSVNVAVLLDREPDQRVHQRPREIDRYAVRGAGSSPAAVICHADNV